ncbi:MAG: BMP family ABC transporter substrate-binding protein [Ruminococcaceae bacterium]|nr:BMP family ABC transporter substrate-binding protein [Oscillospiraceae bacterium]
MKKVLALLLVLVMALTFVACDGNKDTEPTDAPSGGTDYSDVKVGVVHIGDPADGSGYSFAHDQGIVAMQKNLGLKDDQIVRQLNIADNDKAATKTAIEDCIAKGCTIIFTTSYGYMDTTEELAKEYPDVIFSHGTGYKSNDKNFNNYFGRIYQARYLAGIAAGLKSVSGKIGYVAAYGTELAETCSGINAFALGVQSVNPDAKVYVKTLNSWFDPANETAFAEALIEMGCDVIAQHCDTANPQKAAESKGVFGCGYNSDMTAEAPKAHLTAPIWNWGVYYTAAVKAAAEGKWAEFGNYFAGVKEGFVDVSPLSENCAENTQKYIDAVKALYNEGSWDVFSGVKLSFDDNGAVVKTDADLVDNTGKVQVAAGGASIEDGVIQGTMNYFVAGVELK